MARSINLSLTDELRAFLDQNPGDGTLFSTPSEFVRALIREKKERQDAHALRELVPAGYADVRDGHTHEFTPPVPKTARTPTTERRRLQFPVGRARTEARGSGSGTSGLVVGERLAGTGATSGEEDRVGVVGTAADPPMICGISDREAPIQASKRVS